MTTRILLALALIVLLAAPAARAETRLGCQVLPQLVRTYLRNHVNHPELSEEIQQRAVKSYVERLAPPIRSGRSPRPPSSSWSCGASSTTSGSGAAPS
jgi:hypothetical protein